MRKLKVLHIIPDLGPGGAERSLMNLLKFINKDLFEVAACSFFPRQGHMLEEELDGMGIKVFYLNKHLGLDQKIIFELYDLFKLFKPTIVHTHRHVVRYTLIPSSLCNIPLKIHTVHNTAEREVDFTSKIIHWFAFKFFAVKPIGISKEISKTVEKLYKIRDVYFIPNGIDTEKFHIDKQIGLSLRKELGINDNYVLLHIGRFQEQKNHTFLIDAFAEIKKLHPEVVLLLAGDGKLRQEIEEQVAKMNLTNSVFFLGLRQDIPQLLAAADIFVLPSIYEGMPLTILEAMAAGCPVVASAVGGVPEIVTHGATGFLFPSNDKTSMVNYILELLQNSILRKKFGEQAQKTAIKFDIKETVKKYEELYISQWEKYWQNRKR